MPGSSCSPPEKEGDNATTKSGVKSSEATSAEDFGGMDALVKAAKKEGQLNVIALPPTWANYGNIIKGFEDKYGISDQVRPAGRFQPGGDQRREATEGQEHRTGRLRPRSVGGSGQHSDVRSVQGVELRRGPRPVQGPDGTWVNDYGGCMSIGYDSAKVPGVTSVDDLLKPAYKGKVALNGDPTQAGAAFSGVVMVSLSQGGSADDVKPGVDFFAELKKVGNFIPVNATPATVESGQTPVVFDWDYLNAAETKKLPTWEVVVPAGKPVAGYYYQAINKDGPHPASARLWEEYLYSDAGQNLWLAGGARPVRADAMAEAGTLDKAAYDALPKVEGEPTVISEEQSAKATKYLSDNWAKAIG